MRGYVTMILGGEAGPVSETQNEYLKIVNTNVVRLSELIDEILDLESVESGRLSLRLEAEDLSPILTECCDTFRAVAQQKGLKIHYTIPEKETIVLGDRTRLVSDFHEPDL